ncbi:MAG: phospho-N-acetylmuramoyl-pentapeptide-transferase [Holosporales bacterium]|jgi:phospho-N-acetylmuramoyl-pentapeptide-transferase|nr:phospho-N-acetylmuramoyl-pentapeptide-transferase [Holosporales bacterium]
MIYNVAVPYIKELSALNVLRYITFRTAAAFVTSLAIALIIGPVIIKKLKIGRAKQPIRDDGPASHKTKGGTPTMGGAIILLACIAGTILWSDLKNVFIWMVLFVTFGCGLIGFSDDYLKVMRRHSKGLPGRYKFWLQVFVALVFFASIQILAPSEFSMKLMFPFLKNACLDLGWWYALLAIFIVVGASNAVNLTDGLDGLAIGPTIMVTGCLGIMAYLAGHAVFAKYLQIYYVPGAGELAIFCGALVGASVGFLWFNAPPAEIFMGDTGALAIGGALGSISTITKNEIVLAIAGGLFVVETLSVIIQVASFKLRGKRVFLMAPIHHHFEKKGWQEPKIVIRFWIISVVFILCSLLTLKIR